MHETNRVRAAGARRAPVLTGKGGHVAFEIQWSARAAPIDPSPQAVPDSQFVMSSVLIKLNQPSNLKLINRRTSQLEHNHPNPPTHNPHVSATAETAADTVLYCNGRPCVSRLPPVSFYR